MLFFQKMKKNGDTTENDKNLLKNAKSKLAKLTNKQLPLEIKKDIINNIIMKSPEYSWNFYSPQLDIVKGFEKSITKCVKHSIPMNSRTANEFI